MAKGRAGIEPARLARERARNRGAAAELAVAAYLEARSLAILGRNVRVGRLEIDVLAREGAVVVVVEVRSRAHDSSFQRPLDSIDQAKRERVRAAGERLWSERFADDPTVERMRFDVAAVTFGADGRMEIEHIRAAF